MVHGGQAVITSLEGARELAAPFPGAEFVVMEDAGHVPLPTHPYEVVAALQDCWQTTTADRPIR